MLNIALQLWYRKIVFLYIWMFKIKLVFMYFWINKSAILSSKAKFKEFVQQLKFKQRLKYCSFHLKLYSMLQNLNQGSIETGFFVNLRRGSNSLNSDSVDIKSHTENLTPIGLAVLTFIGYKQTYNQTNTKTRKV